mmetsp:Transcript_39617/g.58202  ORF Transcript_39617/g.58202 Transcript_39617/m.58202 type:complete len:116 (+) Transcript_39617:909-1256(+)
MPSTTTYYQISEKYTEKGFHDDGLAHKRSTLVLHEKTSVFSLIELGEVKLSVLHSCVHYFCVCSSDSNKFAADACLRSRLVNTVYYISTLRSYMPYTNTIKTTLFLCATTSYLEG